MNSQLFEILLIAMVAGIVLFRLYTVLGRRTGNERPPQDPRFGVNPRPSASEAGDNVVPPPDHALKPDAHPNASSDPMAQALLDIKLADRAFEAEHFVSGARQAYELIVTAFAKGDRATLKPLLSEEVYHAFDSGIAAREARHETKAFTFVGLKNANVVHAALKDSHAEVTLSFESQFISATSNETGAVIDGDPKAVRGVTDVWTFGRDVRSRDPNWLLVATSGGEP